MKATETAVFFLFFLVINFQKWDQFGQLSTQNMAKASKIESAVDPRRCSEGGAAVQDEEPVCEKTSLCSSRFYSSTRCQCDDSCLHYGDCCIDAPEFTTNQEKDSEFESCQSIGVYGSGYYMISKCPENFLDPLFRSLCEQIDPDDTLGNTPATDQTDKKLFRNLFCAICNGRVVDNIYFWKLKVICPNDEEDETSHNGDDGTSEVDDGTSEVDDGTSAVDDGTSAVDDGTSAVDDGTSYVDDGTSAVDDGTSAVDDGTSAVDDGTSYVDDGTSAVDDGTSAVDDGTSAVDDGTSAVDDGTSAVDDGTSAVDDGTSYVDDGTSAVDDGTSAVDDGTSAGDDGTSNEDIYEDPEGLLILREYLKKPNCIKRFTYRLERAVPYRTCTPIDFPVFEDDRKQQTSCPSYVAPYLSGGNTYRNRECAACHGANTSSSPCDFPEDALIPQGVQSFANLFLFRDGYRLTELSEIRPSPCNDDEILDPFSNVCRTLVARYEPQNMDESGHEFMVWGETYVQDVVEDICAPSDTEYCPGIKESLSSALMTLIQGEVSAFEGQLYIDYITCVESSNQVEFCSEEVQSPAKLCSFSGKLVSTGDMMDVYTHFKQRSFQPLTNENYRNVSCWTNPQMNIQTFTLTPGDVGCSNFSIDTKTSSIGFAWNEGLQETQILSVNGSCVGIVNTCSLRYIHFDHSSVAILNDTHIFLKDTEQTFADGVYHENSDGISICADHLPDECGIKESSETVERIVTIIGHTLSLIGLTATIFTYVIFPRLRNNMGKSILSLVSALLVGQLCQFALWDQTSNAAFCTAVAMVTHYAFLAAFFWMSVLGHDLSRTFGSRAKMQTVRDSKKTFFYFSLYGWGGPLVVVGVSALFHFGDFENLTLRYGTACICWIYDEMALLWSFGAPVVTILVLNFIFFADTVIGIMRARIATKRATSSNTNLINRDSKQDFLLFCKLSCIMGLTWVVSFTAGFVDSQPLTIISIVLNSTQGVLIYIAFGCNPRVIEMWRNSYSKRRLTSSRSNSLAVTAKTSVSSVTGQQINQVRIPRGKAAAHQLV